MLPALWRLPVAVRCELAPGRTAIMKLRRAFHCVAELSLPAGCAVSLCLPSGAECCVPPWLSLGTCLSFSGGHADMVRLWARSGSDGGAPEEAAQAARARRWHSEGVKQAHAAMGLPAPHPGDILRVYEAARAAEPGGPRAAVADSMLRERAQRLLAHAACRRLPVRALVLQDILTTGSSGARPRKDLVLMQRPVERVADVGTGERTTLLAALTAVVGSQCVSRIVSGALECRVNGMVVPVHDARAAAAPAEEAYARLSDADGWLVFCIAPLC